jgi:hypothetical protein
MKDIKQGKTCEGIEGLNDLIVTRGNRSFLYMAGQMRQDIGWPG